MEASEPKKKYPRHFVAKGPNKKGEYWFNWQPSKGLAAANWKNVPLGKGRRGSAEEVAAMAKAEAINATVDQWRGGQPVLAKNRHGTLPWLIEQYKKDESYKRLRRRQNQDWSLSNLLKWSAEFGDPPMRTIKRSDAKALWRRYGDKEIGEGKLAKARDLIKTGRLLWNFALRELEDQDIVNKNPFANLGFASPPPRQAVWEPTQITRFIETALVTPLHRRGSKYRVIGYHKSLADAVVIAVNTAQRPGDVLALTEDNYDGTYIKLTQSKTGREVEIRVTSELKAWLDDMLAVRRDGNVVSLHRADLPLVICEGTRKQYQITHFENSFRKLRTKAGLPSYLQFRDLRRTGIVRLAEAGCTPQECAAISGHSIDETTRILEVYCPRTKTMSDNAIAKLEAYRKRQLEG